MCVGLGGGLGSLLRWMAGRRVIGEHYHGDFPAGTFLINVSGAFTIGYLSVLFKVDWRDRYGAHRRQIVSEGAEMLVGTGIAGGLSTFSSSAYGAVVLMSASTASAVVASFYVVISLVLGYIAVAVGLKLGGQGSA
jgi:fluoride exporter